MSLLCCFVFYIDVVACVFLCFVYWFFLYVLHTHFMCERFYDFFQQSVVIVSIVFVLTGPIRTRRGELMRKNIIEVLYAIWGAFANSKIYFFDRQI